MDNFSVDEGLILAYELHMSECLCLCIQKRSCLFSLLIFFFVGDRFLLLDLLSTMMTFLFWIRSLKFFNLMVPIHPFKRELKH